MDGRHLADHARSDFPNRGPRVRRSPFNASAINAASFGSPAKDVWFKDTWALNDTDLAWPDQLEAKHQDMHSVHQAFTSDSDKVCRICMAVRMLEIRRISEPSSTPSGSVALTSTGALSGTPLHPKRP